MFWGDGQGGSSGGRGTLLAAGRRCFPLCLGWLLFAGSGRYLWLLFAVAVCAGFRLLYASLTPRPSWNFLS